MESLTGLVKVSSNGVIPVALILVFVPHTLKVLSIVSNKQIKGYNYNPREGAAAAVKNLAKKGDEAAAQFIQRCQSCHENAVEAFVFMTAAVLLAKVNGVPEDSLTPITTAWVGTRLLYTWLYVTGAQKWKTTTRSLVWAVGLGLVGYLAYLGSTSQPAAQA